MTQDSCPESPSSSVASFHSTDPASDSDLPFELHRGVDPSSERVGDDSLPQQDPPDDDDEDDTEHDDSIWWTPSELRDILDRSTALKMQGNAEFGHGQWELAMASYREGLAELPVRTRPAASTEANGKAKASDASQESTEVEATLENLSINEDNDGTPEDNSEMKEVSELRSILFANVAACCLKLNRWKDAATACDEALDENPTYLKALHRRALANEAIGSWSSLTTAQEDWNALYEHPHVSPALLAAARAAKTRLPPLIAEQQQKEQAEVMGKLKDLGNTVLGKFGLSTDNFKFVQQPGGGYSMNFER